MKRPGVSLATPTRLRRWLFPGLALAVALLLLDHPCTLGSGFDPAAVRRRLADGRVDQALAMLATAGDRHMLPELAGVNWWPAEARQRRLAMLERDAAATAPSNGPELEAPVGRQRTPPRVALLSRPAQRPLRIQIHNRELNLLANTLQVDPGQARVPLDTTLIAGTTYDLALLEDAQDGGRLLSVLNFEWLSPDVSRDLGVVMASALELAGEGPGGELLAAMVALHYGLQEEALSRFEALADDPLVGAVARQMAAISLARMDLPTKALERLQAGDG